MKKWVMIPLVILVSLITGASYYYYNYIYKAPEAVESRELMETNSSYEYLIQDAGYRIAENSYDCKVLINPVYGGPDGGMAAGKLREADIALSVAMYVEQLNTDDKLGIFLTRDTDTNPTEGQRLRFVEVVDPDIVLEIRVNSNSDTSVIGTSVYYDNEYYDFHLVNSRLADVLEKSIVTEIEGVAEGIFPLEDGTSDFIKQMHRPSALIRCGYITGDKEAAALASETYKSNIAKGILNAIEEVRSADYTSEEE